MNAHELKPQTWLQKVQNTNTNIFIADCKEYVCPGTKQCVKTPIDCDCPFPSSQLKCVLPNKKNYVCISKPAIIDNDKLQQVYDDPVAGPKAHNKGVRDCGWVTDAWNGKV